MWKKKVVGKKKVDAHVKVNGKYIKKMYIYKKKTSEKRKE